MEEAPAYLLGPPLPTDSLVEAALRVLYCADPMKKADYTFAAVEMWRNGTLKRVRPLAWKDLRAPDRPARSDEKVKVCAPGVAPKRGRGGTLASRQALLHSAVHIENWAVDLSWDAVARFGLRHDEYGLPREFFDDFVTVAEDECRHFSELNKRLEELGSHYGAFVVHDGLWESAANSAHSLPARLAVEHCVHEARGLDVLPLTISKFANNGDAASAALLRDVIYPEEINHCAAGVRWLRYLHEVATGRRQPAAAADPDPSPAAAAEELAEAAAAEAAAAAAEAGAAAASEAGAGPGASSGARQELEQRLAALSLSSGAHDDSGPSGAPTGPEEHAPHVEIGDRLKDGGEGFGWLEDARGHGRVESWFHSLVRRHFWGALKPPFNEEARAKAGFGPEWYLPLAAPPAAPAAAAAAAAAAAVAAPPAAAPLAAAAEAAA